MKSPRSIAVLVSMTLVAIAVGPQGASRDARASPASGPAPPPVSGPAIVRIDGASKPAKPPPAPMDPQLVQLVDECVQSAYARLEKSARDVGGGDPALVAATYRARKASTVGASALQAAGCKRPTEW